MSTNHHIDYAILLEHIRDAVLFIRATDGRVLEANRAASQLYGYSESELRHMRIYDLILMPEGTPLNPPDATRNGQITAAGVLFESVHRDRDNRAFPVEVSARLAESHGQFAVVAVVREISERAEAAAALERAYDELEQVFDSAADGMRIVGADFTVLRMNRTLAQMAGVDTSEAVGTKCFESFPGRHCHTDECPLTRVLAGAENVTSEVIKEARDGTTITCMLHAEPFRTDGHVTGIVESFRDITDRKRAEELAQYLATHDALTELPNRMLFTDRLERELVRAQRDGTRPALLYCDVDEFKAINDALGHAAGDDVLRSVARSVTGAIRQVDSVARLGGDEFVVLLSDVDQPFAAEAVARKLVDVVRARSELCPSAPPVTLSVGIAIHRADDTVDSLMHRADMAMYEAKQAGGDRVCVG